jgi:hypothetical protein
VAINLTDGHKGQRVDGDAVRADPATTTSETSTPTPAGNEDSTKRAPATLREIRNCTGDHIVVNAERLVALSSPNTWGPTTSTTAPRSRPYLDRAAGNSNGDVALLDLTDQADRQTLRLLILHVDDGSEFGSTTGTETALERAATDGRTVSVNNDWNAVV